MSDPAAAARWLAEAIESGNPLAGLPMGLAPRSVEEGQEIAALVLEELGLPACGLRLASGPQGGAVPGPLLEARLLHDGAPLALGALPHGLAQAGVAGLLAAPLEPGDTVPPRFTSLHPALDLGSSRFTHGPMEDASQAADLGGLGVVVLGPAGAAPQPGALRSVPVALRRQAGKRVRAVSQDLGAALDRAAEVARASGGLPAGTLLLALVGPAEPLTQGEVVADLGPLGRVRARLE